MYIVMALALETGDKFVAEACNTPEHPPEIKVYWDIVEAQQSVKAYKSKYPKCAFWVKNVTE